MFVQIAFLLMSVGMQSESAKATECFFCSNVTRLPGCTKRITCPNGSTCFSEYATIQGKRVYTLGCKSIWLCPVLSTASTGGVASIVGRSVSGTGNCSECCNTNNCNRQLCQSEDLTCNDDHGYDCASIGAGFNICDDVSHAKTYCRRFCGFCNTVDGGWSSWSEWSTCDVSCGSGVRTKSRTCSDPAPENGGSDCLGETQLHENCTKDQCPTHGGWSQWSEWGSCSSTCDIGLQRRDRSCSNPYPARYGDHCYGDSRSDRLCFPGACANGNWSIWSSWGVCTKTCGGGVKTRSRRCDNPAPSLTGKYCDGDSSQADACNTSPCQGPVVFFAKDLSTVSPGEPVQLRFTQVKTNIGHGYSSSTGYFTAPVGGAYIFNVQICAYAQRRIEIELYVNDGRISHMFVYGDSAHGCRTMSVPVVLKTGDKCHVKTGLGTSSGQTVLQDSYRTNSFSGALLR